MVTQQRLKELLNYSHETGVFTWARPRRGVKNVGAKAGQLDRKGYVRITIDGKKYQGHHLAWLYVHGEMPTNQIDHINEQKGDNRIVNLRCVTSAQNTQIAKVNKAANGRGGCSYHKRSKKWQVSVLIEGKKKHLGYFATEEEARSFYISYRGA